MLGEVQGNSYGDDIFYCYDCKLWQPVLSYSNSKKENSPPLPPWFVPVEKNDKAAKDAPKIRQFFSLSTLEIYNFELPEVWRRNCIGASYGCILTLGPALQINLLHPFHRKQITLPLMLAFCDQYNHYHDFMPQQVIDTFVVKVVLSSNPWVENKDNHNSCVVAAMYGQFNALAFARLGDDGWIDIHVRSRRYEDIVLHKDKLYAVDCHGSILVSDLDDKIDSGPTKTQITPIPDGMEDWIQKCLVESSGDLLLVSHGHDATTIESQDHEHRESWIFYTVKFMVMKLEESNYCGHVSDGYPYK